jgi:hypothetical protein
MQLMFEPFMHVVRGAACPDVGDDAFLLTGPVCKYLSNTIPTPFPKRLGITLILFSSSTDRDVAESAMSFD